MNQTFPTKNITAFNTVAVSMRNDGIPFDKAYINGLAKSSEDECFDIARHYMGADFDVLHNAVMYEANREPDPNDPTDDCDVNAPVRQYVIDVFGMKSLRYFETMFGDVIFDIEHAILFYYRMKTLNFPDMNKVFGFMYYVAGHQFGDELSTLSRGIIRGKIVPSYSTSPNFFGWKKMPFITNKYMMSLTHEEGYTNYYFERQNVGYLAYLMANDNSVGESKKIIDSATSGLFFSWLPLHVENALLPFILSHSYDTKLMDGYLKPLYERNVAYVKSKYDISIGQHTMYNYHVKPHLINLQGVFIDKLKTTMMENGVSPTDVKIYHISPYRVGVMVKNTIDVTNGLGDVGIHLKPVQDFTVRNIIEGVHF